MGKDRKPKRERSRSVERHRHSSKRSHRERTPERHKKHSKHRHRHRSSEKRRYEDEGVRHSNYRYQSRRSNHSKRPEREKTEEELKKERLAKARLLALLKAKESYPTPEESQEDEEEQREDEIAAEPTSPLPVISQPLNDADFENNSSLLAFKPISPRRRDENTTEIDDAEDPYQSFMKDIEGEKYLTLGNAQYQANYDEYGEMSLDESGFSDDDQQAKVITLDQIYGNEEDQAKEDNGYKSEDQNSAQNFIEALKSKVNQLAKLEALNTENLQSFDQQEEFAVPENPHRFGKSQAAQSAQSAVFSMAESSQGERMFCDDEDTFYEDILQRGPEDDYLSRQRRAAEKRELKPVDHSLIQYESFKKNFYIESNQLKLMTPEQVEQFRKENNDIKVRGIKPPRPIFNWYQCGLSNRVLRLIDNRNFVKPTPIQMQAIPTIMSGRDVIGIAETGSGKTLAYVLPLLRHVLDQRPLKDGEGPIALIIAPTRELATQIQTETKSFAKTVGLRCACVYGGAGVGAQLSELKKGAQIVICTPGRMIDVLTTSNGKITNLQRVTYVCLDEADRMFDMGFEPQISRILGNIRPDRQTVLFSATFPRSIENLAKKILQTPVEIVVGNRGQTCQNVDQRVEVVDQDDKFPRLLTILEQYVQEGHSVLIFVDKQTEAGQLFTNLLKSGYECLMLHGGSDQNDREFMIQQFRSKAKPIMISTSVCARGLDIKHLALVINYICPNHAEDYVHRVGRTGRAGNRGKAVTFITADQAGFADELIKMLETSNQPVNKELRTLAAEFEEKVDNGEAYYSKKAFGFLGKGFNFSNEERSAFSQNQKELGKSLVLEDIDGEEGIEVKTAEQRRKEEQEKRSKMAADLLRESKAKQTAMQAAQRAATQAILEGDINGALQRAKEAAKKSIIDYRPNNPVDAMRQVMKIRDEVHQEDEERGGNYSSQIIINDYPMEARAKVQSKEFSDMIFDLTGCGMSSRGEHIETGRKLKLGQEYLHLHISGQNKQDVMAAVREVKKVLEEAAYQLLQQPQTGRYKVA